MTYLMLYFILYKFALCATLPLMMIVLSHTDRVHMRERARRMGVSIKRYATTDYLNDFRYGSQLSQLRVLLELYLLRPICICLEVLVGFTEGVEDIEPIMVIHPKQVETIDAPSLKKAVDVLEESIVIPPLVHLTHQELNGENSHETVPDTIQDNIPIVVEI